MEDESVKTSIIYASGIASIFFNIAFLFVLVRHCKKYIDYYRQKMVFESLALKNMYKEVKETTLKVPKVSTINEQQRAQSGAPPNSHVNKQSKCAAASIAKPTSRTSQIRKQSQASRTLSRTLSRETLKRSRGTFDQSLASPSAESDAESLFLQQLYEEDDESEQDVD